MNWKRYLKRMNFIWLEIGVAVLLGLIVASQALADPAKLTPLVETIHRF